MAHVLASTLARTTAAVTVNSRRYMGHSDLESSIAPMGKRSYMFASPLACTTAADALVNYSGYVRRDFL